MADDDVAYAAELDYMYELADRYLAALKETDLPAETLQSLYDKVKGA